MTSNDELVKRLRELRGWIEHAHKEPCPQNAISIDDVDWKDVAEAANTIEAQAKEIEKLVGYMKLIDVIFTKGLLLCGKDLIEQETELRQAILAKHNKGDE